MEVLLVYIIPTAFILILYILIISNGKTDRCRLREVAQQWSLSQVAQSNLSNNI